MIPDRLPSGASAGEKRVFALLQQLPDEVIVYYEPIVEGRYPDFIVIIPTVGLLVIEAKGWYPTHILSASHTEVIVNPRGHQETHKHPVRQARDYKFKLMDVARGHRETAALLHSSGEHAGRFAFPFGHLAILNNCTRPQLDERNLSQLFPSEKVLTRDELESLNPREIINRLKICFDPWWSFGRLSEHQISILRAVIHPHIMIFPIGNGSNAKPLPRSVKVLDLRQERNAHSLGEGHRIVYGVAGSGKTMLLIARARLIAQDSNKRVLILCFNRALAEHLREMFAEIANVTCLHFHGWGQHNGIQFNKNEDEEAFGERLLQRLQRGEGDTHQYDAVFVDEAQDFSKSWFLCAKFALKEPDDGDFLIVGDGSQSLYRRRKFTWREAGVNALGRTINTRFDLDKNYRNTREILKIASEFVLAEGEAIHPEAGLQIIRPNPDIAMRSGPAPLMLVERTIEGEMRAAVRKIQEWINSGLEPSEIAVLYRANAGDWVANLVSLISQSAPVYWPHDRSRKFEKRSGVCVRTMHSAKGLQWRAVLLVRVDMMPFVSGSDANSADLERLERGLMYVAMTRAEDMLAFTQSTSSGFGSRIQQLLHRDSADVRPTNHGASRH
jgi:hypothetical protein